MLNVLEKMWDKKYTFILHSSLVNKTLRDYVENLESENKVYCQAHVYFGKEGSKSFQIHAYLVAVILGFDGWKTSKIDEIRCQNGFSTMSRVVLEERRDRSHTTARRIRVFRRF